MNSLINTLESIVNKCGISTDSIVNEEIKERNQNKLETIKKKINEITQLKNEKKREKKKKNAIRVIQLTIEIKSKKQELYDYYHQLQRYFIEESNELNSQTLSLIENEMKQFEMNEKKEKKTNKLKRNKTFHIKGLEEYNMNEIPNDTHDNRIEMIQMNDNEINQKLNIVEDNVKTIKLMSENINSQLDDQEMKIQLTQQDIKKNIDKIDNQQQRFRDIILKLNSPHNCCVTFVLICCIIGLFGIIASILYSLI